MGGKVQLWKFKRLEKFFFETECTEAWNFLFATTPWNFHDYIVFIILLNFEYQTAEN